MNRTTNKSTYSKCGPQAYGLPPSLRGGVRGAARLFGQTAAAESSLTRHWPHETNTLHPRACAKLSRPILRGEAHPRPWYWYAFFFRYEQARCARRDATRSKHLGKKRGLRGPSLHTQAAHINTAKQHNSALALPCIFLLPQRWGAPQTALLRWSPFLVNDR